MAKQLLVPQSINKEQYVRLHEVSGSIDCANNIYSRETVDHSYVVYNANKLLAACKLACIHYGTLQALPT